MRRDLRARTCIAALGAAVVSGALASQALAQLPPHHQLWLCVNANEAKGNWHATNGKYRGGLQLHYGWGYGTSYDAAQDSQLEQEWAAERAYIASGHSRAFLIGQWFEWDKAYYCLKYA